MSKSRIAQSYGMVLLVGACSTAANADVFVTYESDIDHDASTPGIIDLNLGESSTITISVIPISDAYDFGGGGFLFAGEPLGSPTVVRNGVIEMSEFLFDEQFDLWFTEHNLPSPGTMSFAVGWPSLPLTLATMTVTAIDVGTTVQDTGAWIVTGDGASYTLTEGSASFTVRGIPEPTTAVLLIIATAMLVRRRRGGCVDSSLA